MTTEPSVWDFLLAKIQFWKKSEINFELYFRDETDTDLSGIDEGVNDVMGELVENQLETDNNVISTEDAAISANLQISLVNQFPWQLLVSLPLIFTGQFILVLRQDSPNSTSAIIFAVLFYLLGAGMLVWSFIKNDLRAPDMLSVTKDTVMHPVKTTYLLLSLPFLLTAGILMGNNRFTFFNFVFWMLGIGLFILSFWVDQPEDWKNFSEKVKKIFTKDGLQIKIRWFEVALILVGVIAVFYRTYLLDSVPVEMFSDQAEKLLDVQDVLDGQYSIFFPRNTGREAFQMYLSALMAKFVGIQFLTLKLGTAICGLLMLPYVYLLGKEIANKRVGLYALFFASIAYWPNVIARVGLRYILYAAFAAPTLYYLYRGLRRQHRNDFVLAGIFLGIGLHGYSSFRFIPIVVVVVAGLYFLHNIKDEKKMKTAIFCVFVIGLVSLVIFIPLARYWLQNPEMFSYRMATRLGTAETDYPGPPLLIFFQNFFKASVMFFYDNGEVWVHSVPHRPALDLITAGFYFIGVLVMILDYFKKWSWEYLSLLVSIPLLLMPSILSLAFPAENPCLNRTSAAMVPVFVLAGFGMDTMMRSLQSKLASKGGHSFLVILTVILLMISAGSNYDLVFNQYAEQFAKGAWNTSDIGQVVKEFANGFGSYDTAYVIPYPHWVDTRLVGINADAPRRDFALAFDFIDETVNQESPKLFIFKYDDLESMEKLMQLYPEGNLRFYDDQYEGKDFYSFIVP